jgi:predicted ABC-type transport system involved in lysophospholipase L1 biosynthesis ATPase subunit
MMNDKSSSKFRNLNLVYLSLHQLLPESTALENVCIPASLLQNRNKKNQLKRRNYYTGLSSGLTINPMLSEGNNSESQGTCAN